MSAKDAKEEHYRPQSTPSYLGEVKYLTTQRNITTSDLFIA
jgi:hypothetical protein